VILADSNVLIDFIDDDGPWIDWSRKALADAQATGPVVVNEVVLAETAPRFRSMGEQADFVEALNVSVRSLDAAAAFRAGQAFREYRRRSGERVGILADFLIAGHASALAGC